MEIFSKNQLIEYVQKYISAPADKPLMVWCGSNPSMDDLYNTLTNAKRFKPSGKISDVENYIPQDAAFAINLDYIDSLNERNMDICISFVQGHHMPLISLVNDYHIPGEAKRPASPYRWGAEYDIDDIEELMPARIKDEFIHVCYKPSLAEYIDELKSAKYMNKDLIHVFIDYANSKADQDFIDPYYLKHLFNTASREANMATTMHKINAEDVEFRKLWLKEENEKILAGEPFTADEANLRRIEINAAISHRDLAEDFCNFLEGTSAAWLIDSTKPHPEPHF